MFSEGYFLDCLRSDETLFSSQDIFIFLTDASQTSPKEVLLTLRLSPVHCLNTLRQIAYGDLYPKVSGGREKPVWKFHVDHCVDILMQELQCSGNLNLVSYHWVENHDRPFPMFGISRQCVDFEALTHWRVENTLDVDKYNSMVRKPLGAKQLRAADDWYKYRAPELTNPNHLNGANPDEKIIL